MSIEGQVETDGGSQMVCNMSTAFDNHTQKRATLSYSAGHPGLAAVPNEAAPKSGEICQGPPRHRNQTSKGSEHRAQQKDQYQ